MYPLLFVLSSNFFAPTYCISIYHSIDCKTLLKKKLYTFIYILCFTNVRFPILFLFISARSLHHAPTQRGSDELLSQAAVMAPASDNNNQDLATKKAKLETSNSTTSTVLGGVGEFSHIYVYIYNISWLESGFSVNCIALRGRRKENTLHYIVFKGGIKKKVGRNLIVEVFHWELVV